MLCSLVSLLLHDCRHRVRCLQRLLLLPRPLPLRCRPHTHDSLLQVLLTFQKSFFKLVSFVPTFKWSAEGKVPKSLKPFLAQTSAAINFIFQLYKVPEEAVGYNTGGKD